MGIFGSGGELRYLSYLLWKRENRPASVVLITLHDAFRRSLRLGSGSDTYDKLISEESKSNDPPHPNQLRNRRQVMIDGLADPLYEAYGPKYRPDPNVSNNEIFR